MSKLTRGIKGEDKVKEVLSSLKEYHHVLNDISFINDKTSMTHQIDHILIHPLGVFLLETKNYYGRIEIDRLTKTWYKIVNNKRIRISNPLSQNKGHLVILNRVLSKKYEVIPLIVFVKNNAPYIDNTSNDNLINLDDLLLFISSYPSRRVLSNNEIDKIKETIERTSYSVSSNEHIENIKILKAYKKEQEGQISYALTTSKCPWCDSPIKHYKNNEYKCSKCNFGFKL